MTPSIELIVGLALLYFVSLMFALTIGIQLGQSGVVRVERDTRKVDERRLKRHLKHVGKLIGAAEADITEIIDSAVERMRAVADADRNRI